MTDDGAEQTCRECGESFLKPKDLSMHNRIVHSEPLQLGLADRRDESVDSGNDQGEER